MNGTSYIITWRGLGDPARKANLKTVLEWLALLQPAEVLVIEQDVAPSLSDLPSIPGLRSVFAYNPGPFNKSWGLNIGARFAVGSVLAFGDADVLCGSLPAAVAQCRGNVLAVRPFSGIRDLDAAESALVREDLSCLRDPSFTQRPADRKAIGEFPPICGGIVLFRRELFGVVGGWDERFLGWGGEDDAMDIKLRRAMVPVGVLNVEDGFHLWHERVNKNIVESPDYQRNLALLEQLQTLSDAALRRLCEVSAQLGGYPEMLRPAEPKR